MLTGKPPAGCGVLLAAPALHPVHKEVCGLLEKPRRAHAVVAPVEDTKHPLAAPRIVQVLRVVRQHERVVGRHPEEGRAGGLGRAPDRHQLQRVEGGARRHLRPDHVEGPAHQELRHREPPAVHQLLRHGPQVPEGGVQDAGRQAVVLRRPEDGRRGAHGAAPEADGGDAVQAAQVLEDGAQVLLLVVPERDVLAFRPPRAGEVQAEDGEVPGEEHRQRVKGLQAGRAVPVEVDHARPLCLRSLRWYEVAALKHASAAPELQVPALVDALAKAELCRPELLGGVQVPRRPDDHLP
mmetsp:Transcript_33447/g.104079  ORF Transcript_33447/g.104079 Transcript_33447/m.104079 type:complete len:295 (+) Transcript_33447:1228-2112(+)